MNWPRYHHSGQIQQDWQRTMDTGLEAGEPALLTWGTARYQLDDLPILSAYLPWNARRTDVTRPLMLTGSTDSSWPAPLLLPPPSTGGADPSGGEPFATPPPIQFVYGGADRVTHMASMTTQVATHQPAGSFFTTDLPTAMYPLFFPIVQPHAQLTWRLLPLGLLFISEQQTIPRQRTAAEQSIALGSKNATDPWLAWLTFVAIIALILLALLN